MKIDFYTYPHQCQRNKLFTLSTLITKINFDNMADLYLIGNELKNLLTELRDHSYHEETFVHPLLIQKIPQISNNFHHQHNEFKQWYLDLENQMDYIKSLPENHPKANEQGLTFYRLFNRFISVYLLHMDEEEQIMPLLWEVALPEELNAMMLAFKTYANMDKIKETLNHSLAQFNQEEQLRFFQTAKLLAPAAIYIKMCDLANDFLLLRS